MSYILWQFAGLYVRFTEYDIRDQECMIPEVALGTMTRDNIDS